MFEYDLNAQLTAQKLMTIPDFKKLFLIPNIGESPYTIMAMIQEAYDNKAFSQELIDFFALPPFEKEVFACMTIDEFMVFCREIYDVHWGEEITYWLSTI